MGEEGRRDEDGVVITLMIMIMTSMRLQIVLGWNQDLECWFAV